MHLTRTITFASLALLVAGSASASTLTVGAGKAYATPCAAIAAAAAGDVIEVDAGSYPKDTCAWSTDALTIRGVGGRAKIDLTGATPSQRKGIFTIYAANATIESFELSGAAISVADGNNGAGIRHQGTNLVVRDCYFHDNQNGILGAPSTAGAGEVLIERSEFAHNGAGDGYSHNMYLGNYAKFTLRYSYSHRGNVGHLVKSRAHQNLVLYNRLTDEDGTASYELDLPNAGTSWVIGNVIEQAATTQNPAMLSFGEEGVPSGYDDHLFVVNDTFLNHKGSGTFVAAPVPSPALLQNDLFWNGGTICSQASAIKTSNFDSSMGDPKLADLAGYDVHLLAGSPCIDTGTSPGTGGGQALSPTFEYVHPRSATPRAVVGSGVDIGAYEYGIAGADAGPTADAGADAALDASVLDDAATDAASGDDAATDAATGGDAAGDAGGTTATPDSSGCSCHLDRGGDARADLLGLGALAFALALGRRGGSAARRR